MPVRDYEASIISSLINNIQSRQKIFSKIKESDFFRKKTKSAYEFLVSLWENNIPIDSQEIQDKCWLDFGDLISMGNIHYSEAIPGLINSSVRKNCERHLQTLLQNISSGDLSLSEMQDEINKTINHTADWRINLEHFDIADIAKKALRMISEESTTVFWGLSEIDEKARLENSTINIVGARPRVGKTALMLSCIVNQLKEGLGVGIWCAEMTKEDLFLRLISIITGISFYEFKFNYKKLSEEKQNKFSIALDWIKSQNIHIKAGTSKASEINVWMTEIVKTKKVEVIWCDFLQRIIPSLPDKVGRRQQISDISKQLLNSAQELKIPVIVLAQLGRVAENVFPEIHHLQECSAIEEDAHIVLLIDRPAINKPNIKKRGYYVESVDQDWNGTEKIQLDEQMENNLSALIIAKNRNGTTGVRFLRFHGTSMKFTNPGFDFIRKK